MQYCTTEAFDSKLVPGLRYTLNKMSHGRRVRLNQQMAPIMAKASELERERKPLLEEIEQAEAAAKIAPCSCQHEMPADDCHDPNTLRCNQPACDCRKPEPPEGTYERLVEINTRELEITLNELAPVYCRWGIKSIEGLEIDGEPVTVETLIESAPEGLITEVMNEIMRLSRMSTEEQLAFKSPSTSVGQVDGQTPAMSVPHANDKSSTEIATADASTQNK